MDVLLGFSECTGADGKAYSAGDSAIAAGDGCNTCTCNADGTLACTEMACPTPCDFDGKLHQPGATFAAADGCNTCECTADGTVVCTETACPPPCQGAPLCDQPLIMGCVADPVCNPDGSWDCVVSCECGGATGIPECPAPPTGCFFTGPYCDGQQWTCGDLYCDGCQSQPDVCVDPGIAGCWAEPWCDGFNWTCIVNCDPCAMEVPPFCTPMSADCMSYPYCDPMYGWLCYEECPMPGCPDPPPLCESMEPNCIAQPVCIDATWYCELAC